MPKLTLDGFYSLDDKRNNGKEINVSFIEFIRDEKRFGSLAELRTQIKMDRDAANKMIPGVYKPEGL